MPALTRCDSDLRSIPAAQLIKRLKRLPLGASPGRALGGRHLTASAGAGGSCSGPASAAAAALSCARCTCSTSSITGATCICAAREEGVMRTHAAVPGCRADVLVQR